MTHDVQSRPAEDDMAGRMAFDDGYRDGFADGGEVDWQRMETDAWYRRGVGQGRYDHGHGQPMDSQW